MAELARGSIADRPWGRTLATLGRRAITGQLTLAADGKRFAVAFERGAVVAASSPLASDAAVRVALTGHLVSSSQVPELARRQAAAPDRDEVDLIAELARLGPDHALRLRRRVIAQRAARTFSMNQGEFAVTENIELAVLPGCELDVRAVVYLGARNNLSEQRLAGELAQLAGWFRLRAEADVDLPQYGFSDVEQPVIERLRDGGALGEIEDFAASFVDSRTVRAVIYALAACGSCDLEPAPVQPRTGRAASPSLSPSSEASQPIPPLGPSGVTAPRVMTRPIASQGARDSREPGDPSAARSSTAGPRAMSGPVPVQRPAARGPSTGTIPLTSLAQSVGAAGSSSGAGGISWREPAGAGAQPGGGRRSATDEPASGGAGAQVGSGRRSATDEPGGAGAQVGSGRRSATDEPAGAGSGRRSATDEPGGRDAAASAQGERPARNGGPAMAPPSAAQIRPSGRAGTTGGGATGSGASSRVSPDEASARAALAPGAPSTAPRAPGRASDGDALARGTIVPGRTTGAIPVVAGEAARREPARAPTAPDEGRRRNSSSPGLRRPIDRPDRPEAGPGVVVRNPLEERPAAPARQRNHSDSQQSHEVKAVIAQRLKLLDQGADHFQLLGVARDVSAEGLRKAYFAIARQLHPDRLAALGISDDGKHAQRLFAQINAGFAALNDPARRAEYVDVLRRGGEAAVRAEQAQAEAMTLRILEAEEAFRRAEQALRRDQPASAIGELERAIQLNADEVDYHATLAWARFAAAPDKAAAAPAARSELEQAIQRAPKSVAAKFYLGRVERMTGRDAQALRWFREVLGAAPGHADAASELRVLEARMPGGDKPGVAPNRSRR